jgi:hypothetical protein
MREFKVKGYNRKQKKVFDVVGITGLNQGDSRVQSADTTMMLADVDILLYTGEMDSKNNRLFESDTVEYPVEEKDKTFIMQCRIVFKYAAFKLEYSKPTGVNKFVVTTIENPKWKLCVKIGTIYDKSNPV